MRRSVVSGLILSLAAAAAALAARPSHHAGGGAAVLHISSHLAEAAQVTLDGKAITAPGYGSTTAPVAAGHHVMKVKSVNGVDYQAAIDLKLADLMTWKGKGYWCVNLLESSLQSYSSDECQEDVTDAG